MDLWTQIPPAWRTPLSPVRTEIAQISAALEGCSDVIPAPNDVFAALRVPPQEVRVVIVGQDPYPRRDHACGLAFSVPPGTNPLPASLRNILREVVDDIGDTIAASGDLNVWVEQGVLLLNRSLTTVEGSSDAHRSLGWAPVTERIIAATIEVAPKVVGVLWGAAAQQLSAMFDAGKIVSSAHPSPLSAYRGFLGSRPFSAVNAILQQSNQPPVRW